MKDLMPVSLDIVSPVGELFADGLCKGDSSLSVVLLEPIIEDSGNIFAVDSHLVELVRDFPADEPSTDCRACCRADSPEGLQRCCPGSAVFDDPLDPAYKSLDAAYKPAAVSASGKRPEETAERSAEFSGYDENGACDCCKFYEFPDSFLRAFIESVPPFLEALHGVS